MESEYTLKKKKQLVNKIRKIKSKKALCEIYGIILKHNTITSNEVNKHLFMYFHDLSDETYDEIYEYVKRYKKRQKKRDRLLSQTDDTMLSTEEYKPYSQDDIVSQRNLSPKLKYSNKEKSLIKRRMYDKKLSEYTENVIYCKFDPSENMNTGNINMGNVKDDDETIKKTAIKIE